MATTVSKTVHWPGNQAAGAAAASLGSVLWSWPRATPQVWEAETEPWALEGKRVCDGPAASSSRPGRVGNICKINTHANTCGSASRKP